MNVEFIVAEDDNTWRTVTLSVPDTESPREWFERTQLGRACFRRVVYFGVYCCESFADAVRDIQEDP